MNSYGRTLTIIPHPEQVLTVERDDWNDAVKADNAVVIEKLVNLCTALTSVLNLERQCPLTIG